MLRQEAQLTTIRNSYKNRYTAGNGNYVKVKHNNTYSTQYAHVKILVRRGQHVNQGDVIGRVGSTGLATGPMFVIVLENGRQVDAKVKITRWRTDEKR
jgi:murein DD-endopeptidase MepM/ murein hydrolase activator NlpD